MNKVEGGRIIASGIIILVLTSIGAAQSGDGALAQLPELTAESQSAQASTHSIYFAPASNAFRSPILNAASTAVQQDEKKVVQQSGAPPANKPDGGANHSGADDKKDSSKRADDKKDTSSKSTQEVDRDACPDNEDQHSDCRGVFVSSFYIGLAIDTFSGDDMLKYLNPGDSGKIHERAIGGIDFEYRLLGDRMPAVKFRNVASNRKDIESGKPCDASKGQDCLNVEWHPKNLWVYGETMHGVRSADVDCTKNPDLPVCAKSLTTPTNPGEQFYYILRSATSLEGAFGFRWEFLGLQQKAASPINLYLKGQAGFLSLAGAPGSALDVDHVGLGAVATKGNYQNSYLEVGYGRSDMFATARRKRLKVDGYLQRKITDKTKLSAISLFVQMFVDTDLGRGSDAIQSFIGLNFDLSRLLGGDQKTKGTEQNTKKAAVKQ